MSHSHTSMCPCVKERLKLEAKIAQYISQYKRACKREDRLALELTQSKLSLEDAQSRIDELQKSNSRLFKDVCAAREALSYYEHNPQYAGCSSQSESDHE